MFAKVAVDIGYVSDNLSDLLYYHIPENLKDEIYPGLIVRVPFGNKEIIGYIIELVNNIDSASNFKIKDVHEIVYRKGIWDKKYFEFVNWFSKYYMCSIGTALSSSISSEIINDISHEIKLIKEPEANIKLTNFQNKLIELLIKSKGKNLNYTYTRQKLKLNRQEFYQLVNQLKNKNIIEIIASNRAAYKPRIESDFSYGFKKSIHEVNKKIVLNNEQKNALDKILNSISKFSVFLLHGVTGSGKTEVYLNVIEEILKNNKNAIFLVPEIYLISQTYQRLSQRFKDTQIIIWHSSLSKAEKIGNLEAILNDSKKIVIGTRSSILAPLKNIGAIIIDEAHDQSYKQSSQTPRYDAINAAKKRAELEECPVILGTATPNISDYYSSLKNNSILNLSKRINDYPMPDVHIVDLRNEIKIGKSSLLSNLLKENISKALSKNEQIILLLNRRGYSNQVFCTSCGYIQFCKDCSVPLVYHKNSELLVCHHCNYRIKVNSHKIYNCPNCRAPHFKHYGIGIQRLEEEVKSIFSDVKIIRADSDQLQKKDEYIHLWEKFSSGEANILIGTQIVAKGLDLPNVTVVGIVLADSMFGFPDYISFERAYQLLVQVTGRTGRGKKPGNVYIQTYQADNPIFNYVKTHDFNSFYQSEIFEREKYSYPPFTNLTRIILQSYTEQDCLDYAHEVLNCLSEVQQSLSNATISNLVLNTQHSALSTQLSAPQLSSPILGPAPCFFTKLHGKFRYHILCKTTDEKLRYFILNSLFKKLKKSAKVDLLIDIDSVNLL